MHAPPRERLFILFAMIATVAGLLLAADDDRWMRASVCAGLVAVAMSWIARGLGDWRAEEAAAIAWYLALVVGVRWVTVPAVSIPLAFATVVGIPIVLARAARERRGEIRSARTQCVECGYDLRETAERCPECGRTINPDVERLRRIADEIRAARAGVNRPFTPPTSARPRTPADASDAPQRTSGS